MKYMCNILFPSGNDLLGLQSFIAAGISWEVIEMDGCR